MPKFTAQFTRSDTLDFLPNEEIEIKERKFIYLREVMEIVEKRRRALSKKIGCRVLFVVLANDEGQIINYNMHNF